MDAKNGISLVSPSNKQSKGIAKEKSPRKMVRKNDSKEDTGSRITLPGNWGPESPNPRIEESAVTADRVNHSIN